MRDDKKPARLRDEIDTNLKLVYEEILREEVPEHLKVLLEELRRRGREGPEK